MEIQRDNFEYALSQYADGTLNELDRQVVDERLAADAEVRLLLSDFRHIDTLLRGTRELPAIDFDAFAASISRAIDAEASYVAAPLLMRLRWLAPAAAAALLAIVAVAGLRLHGSPAVPVAAGSAVITGPAIEVARAAPAVNIGVGPSDILAKRGDTLSLGDEAIALPNPKVVISAAGLPPKDDIRPY